MSKCTNGPNVRPHMFIAVYIDTIIFFMFHFIDYKINKTIMKVMSIYVLMKTI